MMYLTSTKAFISFTGRSGKHAKKMGVGLGFDSVCCMSLPT